MLLNFFYGQEAPTAEDLKEQILHWCIGGQDRPYIEDVVRHLILAYIEAHRLEVEEEGEGADLKLLTGREAEQLSAKVYCQVYGWNLTLEELWAGNSGWTWPDSLPYEADKALLPKEIVVTVTQAIAERDRAVTRQLRDEYLRKHPEAAQ